MRELSEIPSMAIEQAVQDLEAVEADSRYVVDMGDWHRYFPEYETCSVCLAGAVMAKSLNAAADKDYSPTTLFDPSTSNRLRGLDKFRAGLIDEGLRLFGRGLSIPMSDVVHMSYGSNPALFKQQMRELAARLRAAGL